MRMNPAGYARALQEKVPISEIASHYTELKPMGPGTWQCVCPFHDDKNPSMGLSDDKGVYNCFSCGASGNTITFVKNMDDLSFVDAVRKVAKLGGVPLDAAFERAVQADLPPDYQLRRRIEDVLDKAAAWYAHLVVTDLRAGGARGHLMDRFVSPRTLVTYGLGFAPPYSSKHQTLVANLTAQGHTMEDLVASGLVVNGTDAWNATQLQQQQQQRRQVGNLYDRFRNRVMVPIRRATDGAVVGFGGRQLPGPGSGSGASSPHKDDENGKEKGGPKYLNSPDSPVFKKGSLLFGLDVAKAGAAAQGYTLLVEGYFDVISLFEVGVTNAAGVLGTAITREQIILATQSGKVKTVVLLMDEDIAGQAATQRACLQVLPTLPPAIEVKIATLRDAGLSTKVVPKDSSDLVCHFLNKKWDDDSRRNAKAAVDKVVAGATEWKKFMVDGMLAPALVGDMSQSTAIDAVTDFIASALSNAPADRTLMCYYAAERLGEGRPGLRLQLEADLLKIVNDKVKNSSAAESKGRGAAEGRWVERPGGKKVWQAKTKTVGASTTQPPSWQTKMGKSVGKPVVPSVSPKRTGSTSQARLPSGFGFDRPTGHASAAQSPTSQPSGSDAKLRSRASSPNIAAPPRTPQDPPPETPVVENDKDLLQVGIDLSSPGSMAPPRRRGYDKGYRRGGRTGEGSRGKASSGALWENLPGLTSTGAGAKLRDDVTVPAVKTQRAVESEALLLAIYVHLRPLRRAVLDSVQNLAEMQVALGADPTRGYVWRLPLHGEVWRALQSLGEGEEEAPLDVDPAEVVALLQARFAGEEGEGLGHTILSGTNVNNRPMLAMEFVLQDASRFLREFSVKSRQIEQLNEWASSSAFPGNNAALSTTANDGDKHSGESGESSTSTSSAELLEPDTDHSLSDTDTAVRDVLGDSRRTTERMLELYQAEERRDRLRRLRERSFDMEELSSGETAAGLDPTVRAQLSARAWEKKVEALDGIIMDAGAAEWEAAQSDDEYEYPTDVRASGSDSGTSVDAPAMTEGTGMGEEEYGVSLSATVNGERSGGVTLEMMESHLAQQTQHEPGQEHSAPKYRFDFEEGDERVLTPDDTSFEDELRRLNELMQGRPEGPRQSRSTSYRRRQQGQESTGPKVEEQREEVWEPANNREVRQQAVTQMVFKKGAAKDKPEVPDRLKKKLQQRIDGWEDLGGTLYRIDDDDIVGG